MANNEEGDDDVDNDDVARFLEIEESEAKSEKEDCCLKWEGNNKPGVVVVVVQGWWVDVDVVDGDDDDDEIWKKFGFWKILGAMVEGVVVGMLNNGEFQVGGKVGLGGELISSLTTPSLLTTSMPSSFSSLMITSFSSLSSPPPLLL